MHTRAIYLCAIGAIAFSCGCGQQHTAEAAARSTAQQTPAPSRVTPGTYETSGPITVENQVDVVAEREGVVAEIVVSDAASVRQGQVLARLDDRQLQADRDAAASMMEASAAELKNYEMGQKLVEIDLDRDEKMYQANLITRQQLDHSRTRVIGAKYEVEREHGRYQSAESQLKSLDAELSKTRIVAPFAGVVARRYIRKGQRVKPGDKLFWVTETRPLRVQFMVPESFAGKVHAGDQIEVQATADSELSCKARITLVSPVVDPASGTMDVQAQLESPPRGLLPGMSATVVLQRHP